MNSGSSSPDLQKPPTHIEIGNPHRGKADYLRVVFTLGGAFRRETHILSATLSTGNGFGSTLNSSDANIGNAEGRAWVDFDGDGRTDFVRVVADNIRNVLAVTFGSNTGFGPTVVSDPVDPGYPRWGFWKLFDRMRVERRAWNHKLVTNLQQRAASRQPWPGAAAHVFAEAFIGRPVSLCTVYLTGKLTRSFEPLNEPPRLKLHVDMASK